MKQGHFEGENFTDIQITTKSAKLLSLKLLRIEYVSWLLPYAQLFGMEYVA